MECIIKLIQEKILDAVAGLWCVNAGHCREKIVKAVQDQVTKNGLWFVLSDGS